MPVCLQVELGLLRDVARVARVVLAGDRVLHEARDVQRGVLRERIHVRGVGSSIEQHVRLLDLLEPADRRAVERLPVGELLLGQLVDRQRQVLDLSRQVGEAKIHDLGPGFLGHGDDVLGRLRVRHDDSFPSVVGDAPRLGGERHGSVTRALTLGYDGTGCGGGRRRRRRPLVPGGMGGDLSAARPATAAGVLSVRPQGDPCRIALHERGLRGGAEGDESQERDELRGGEPGVHAQGIDLRAHARAEPSGVIFPWVLRARSSGPSAERRPKGSLVGADAVADGADRLDQLLVLGSELRAQAADMDVDGAGAAVEVVSPHLAQQGGARVDAAGMGCQEAATRTISRILARS